MVERWGSFVRTGSPSVDGRVAWPAPTGPANRLLSLRPGDQSTVISGTIISGNEYGAEHWCSFRDSTGAAAEG